MGERTFQQQLVWTRLKENLAEIMVMNSKLEGKASVIAASSSAIVAIVAGAKMLPLQRGEGTRLEAIMLAGVCACGVALYWFLAKVLMPRHVAIPGTSDSEELWEQYISKDEDTAYNNALIDLEKAVEFAIKENVARGDAVVGVVRAFQWQLAFLAGAILVHVWSASST